MVQKNASLTDQEWMNLIRECRSSGLSDKHWCADHGIPVSTFYSRVSRLRKKACQIPAASARIPEPAQQVVPVSILKEDVPLPVAHTAEGNPGDFRRTETCAVSVVLGSVRLEIHNHASRDVIQNVLSSLRMTC